MLGIILITGQFFETPSFLDGFNAKPQASIRATQSYIQSVA